MRSLPDPHETMRVLAQGARMIERPLLELGCEPSPFQVTLTNPAAWDAIRWAMRDQVREPPNLPAFGRFLHNAKEGAAKIPEPTTWLATIGGIEFHRGWQ